MPTEPNDGGRLANRLVDDRRMEERFASVVIDLDDGYIDPGGWSWRLLARDLVQPPTLTRQQRRKNCTMRRVLVSALLPALLISTPALAQTLHPRHDETMLIWDEQCHWGDRIDRTTAPIARAQLAVNELEFDSQGTQVIRRLATDPGEAFEYLAGGTPFAACLQQLYKGIMKGLEDYLKERRVV